MAVQSDRPVSVRGCFSFQAALDRSAGVWERQRSFQALSQLAAGWSPGLTVHDQVRDAKVSSYRPAISGLISVRYNGGHFLVVHNHTRSAGNRRQVTHREHNDWESSEEGTDDRFRSDGGTDDWDQVRGRVQVTGVRSEEGYR